MNKSNNLPFILIIAIAVIGCLCICIAGIAGTGFLFWNLVRPVEQIITTAEVNESMLEEVHDPTITPNSPEITPNQTPSVESTASILPSQTIQATGQPPNASLPPDVASQMNEIEYQVTQIRGLRSETPVIRQLLTRDQLRQHIIDDFLKDYSEDEASDDAIFLSALGLLDPDFDLYDFYLELYTEQIAGFYDDETNEMFVVQGTGFNGPERLTYAHEFVHALQDISYGTETGLGCNDDDWEDDSERCAAYQALVEGDASYVETLWFSENATSEDAEEIQEFYNSYESPVYDSSPAFMREDFLFPYTSGQPFVLHLYLQGSWQAINNAFENPPVSTEQILHPEKYPDDIPVKVEIPDLTPVLGEGWREIDTGIMGEWSTYLILAYGLDPKAQLDTITAQNASAGWGGDAYAVYYNDQERATALVLSSTWDSEEDAAEFSEAFSEYANARFGLSVDENAGLTSWDSSSSYTTLSKEDNKTIWISAPSSEIEQSIRDAVNKQ